MSKTFLKDGEFIVPTIGGGFISSGFYAKKRSRGEILQHIMKTTSVEVIGQTVDTVKNIG